VAPVWLKSPRRVAALLWLYFVVELVQALVEQEVRRQMRRRGVRRLNLYPEGRPSKAPTAGLVFAALAGHGAPAVRRPGAVCYARSTTKSPSPPSRFLNSSVLKAPPTA